MQRINLENVCRISRNFNIRLKSQPKKLLLLKMEIKAMQRSVGRCITRWNDNVEKGLKETRYSMCCKLIGFRTGKELDLAKEVMKCLGFIK